jgi:hypothetical protein
MINPKITPAQKFLITGTILGGSSIIKPQKGKNCYLSMRDKDLSWLKFKADQMKELSSQSPMTIEKTNRWHSVCYPVFNEFRDMFYKDGDRSLNVDLLNLLHDSSIAIWFGDAGKCKGGRAVFNTNIWGKKGTDIIVEYFKSLDWECDIFMERKNHRVRLGLESTEEMLKMCAAYLPKDRRCGKDF